MIIKRPLPDGTYELWPISDFKPKEDNNWEIYSHFYYY